MRYVIIYHIVLFPINYCTILFIRSIVECILEELMAVLPDLFAENTDVDNEHLPANSVCYTI